MEGYNTHSTSPEMCANMRMKINTAKDSKLSTGSAGI